MGGGGGSLVSGRGAADALARMTSVAGGFFLVTSLGLTFLSGAAGADANTGSIFDNAPAAAPIAAPPPSTPDEGAALDPAVDAATVDAADSAEAPPVSPDATARAAPIAAPPTTAAPRPTRTADATAPRPAAPTTAPRNTAPTNSGSNRPLVLPNSSGGAALTLDPGQLAEGESVQTGERLEAVRRERAGPDQ